MAQEIATGTAMVYDQGHASDDSRLCEYGSLASTMPNYPSLGECAKYKEGALREMMMGVTCTMPDLPFPMREDLEDSEDADINWIHSIRTNDSRSRQISSVASESTSASSLPPFDQGRASDEPRLCEHWVEYRPPGGVSTMPELPSLAEYIEYEDGTRKWLINSTSSMPDLPYLTVEDLEFISTGNQEAEQRVLPPDSFHECNRVADVFEDVTLSEYDELHQARRVERPIVNRSDIRRLGFRSMPARDPAHPREQFNNLDSSSIG